MSRAFLGHVHVLDVATSRHREGISDLGVRNRLGTGEDVRRAIVPVRRQRHDSHRRHVARIDERDLGVASRREELAGAPHSLGEDERIGHVARRLQETRRHA